MKQINFAATILAIAFGSGLVTSAQAVIINPTYVSGTNLNTDAGLGFNPVNLTSDSSLSAPVPTGASLAQAQAAVFTGSGNFGSYWESNSTGGSAYFSSQAAPTFIFDLGSNNTISNIVLWNGYATNANQAKGFSLNFSDDGTTFSGFYSDTLAASNVGNVENAQTFALSGISSRYVGLTLTSNYAGAPGMPGGDRVGLGKVRFDVATPVPEPETWTLMLAGIGAVGFAMRRRTKGAVSCA